MAQLLNNIRVWNSFRIFFWTGLGFFFWFLGWYHLPSVRNGLELKFVILHGICNIWTCSPSFCMGFPYMWACSPSILYGICTHFDMFTFHFAWDLPHFGMFTFHFAWDWPHLGMFTFHFAWDWPHLGMFTVHFSWDFLHVRSASPQSRMKAPLLTGNVASFQEKVSSQKSQPVNPN